MQTENDDRETEEEAFERGQREARLEQAYERGKKGVENEENIRSFSENWWKYLLMGGAVAVIGRLLCS